MCEFQGVLRSQIPMAFFLKTPNQDTWRRRVGVPTRPFGRWFHLQVSKELSKASKSSTEDRGWGSPGDHRKNHQKKQIYTMFV